MVFWKYQGAGNDFIMIDQRDMAAVGSSTPGDGYTALTRDDTARIQRLCDRRFGIGADGLILLQHKPGYDFEMVYFNADGRESTMCGNGGRCIVAFAEKIGVAGNHCHFWAIDSAHEAKIYASRPGNVPTAAGMVWVELKMMDVASVVQDDDATFVLHTGSPHFIRFITDLKSFSVVPEGRAIRYSPRFEATGGINVNFVEDQPNGGLAIRTYERGVEDETLACGTGVTAATLAGHLKNGNQPGIYETSVRALGDALSVRFRADGQGHFTDIWLCGPATAVFEGVIT